jgi:sialate O-acetylesterase
MRILRTKVFASPIQILEQKKYSLNREANKVDDIKLPMIFQNGLVLQRRRPVCIWGWAVEGSQITVELAGQNALAVTKNGEWKAFLPPMEAGTGYTLKISSDSREIVINDVAVGEVWLASGQSNMEFLLRDDEDAASAAKTHKADVRCFEVPKISYPGQENDRDYSNVELWRKACGKETHYFTAVGYYFAEKLNQELNVPVGVINCTWGGTSASVFMAEEYLTGRLKFFLDRAKEAQSKIDHHTELERFKALQKSIDALPINNSVPNLAPIYLDKAMMDAFEEMNSLQLSVYSPFRPCGLYETMLKTIVPYTVNGVIWYQGESDEPFFDLYEELLHSMIVNWRNLWHEDLPFILVQLSSFERMVEPLDFVPIRAIQENLTKTMDKVWLICSMDVGMRYDIHPKKKKPIGNRLALQALSKVYGQPILADSPKVEGFIREGSTICIRFSNCGDGLQCLAEHPQTVEVKKNNTTVNLLSVSVHDNVMLISSPELEAEGPVVVEFCWHPYCEDNVYNSAGLPVFPFVCRME